MRRALVFVAVGLVLVSGCSGGGGSSNGGSEFVFALIDEPPVLDGALVSDRDSLRVVAQIFEGLTALAPGTTRVVPKLALRWRAEDGGRTWTFLLRRGVRFQDGTRFDARAVCFNFERWYGFRASLQNPDVSYYWHAVFGGFRRNAQASYGPSLFRDCRVRGSHTVELRLTRPYGPLPAALALPSFSIASPSAIERYEADKGSVASSGEFRPSETYGRQHPTGTGPFRFRSWDSGRITLERNPGYWGPRARLDQVVFRPIADTGDRLDALLDGDVDAEELYTRADVAAVARRGTLRVVSRPPFDVGYVGSNLRPPFDRLAVRRALAYGLRPSAVLSLYPPGAAVAVEPTPPSLAGYAPGVRPYPYDPRRAEALLRAAGLRLPVRTTLWYPSEVARPYMLAPRRIAERFAAGLERAGFRVSLRAAPWLPDYLGAVRAGQAPLYLLGWVGEVPDAGDFLGRLGAGDDTIEALVARARREPDPVRRAGIYREANRLAAERLPAVPYVTTRAPVGLATFVRGFLPSPLGIESFATVSITPS